MPGHVKPCTCKHEYQDEKYGKGMRLHTWGPKRGGRGAGFICTVCGRFTVGHPS